jgi:UDP-glucose 4-epimerase
MQNNHQAASVAHPQVLVTGGAGFIGSHISDALVAADYSVGVIDNLSTGKLENLNPAVRLHQVDLRDSAEVARVVAEEQPEVICHQAALCNVRESVRDPVGYAEVNVVGTLNLLQAASEAHVKRFILASTGGAVYGEPQDLPATEASPCQPIDPYGASKLACERYLHTYRHNFGLDTVILRYANVYGPRQDPRGEAGVIAIFAARMLNGEVPIINGDGCQARDYVYVGDVARANMLALHGPSGTYNIGTGVPTDVNTIYRNLARLTGYSAPEQHGPAMMGEVRVIYLDIGRAFRQLGWVPAMPLSKGLAQTVAYLRDHRVADMHPALYRKAA